jgi:hypothetical protein
MLNHSKGKVNFSITWHFLQSCTTSSELGDSSYFHILNILNLAKYIYGLSPFEQHEFFYKKIWLYNVNSNII